MKIGKTVFMTQQDNILEKYRFKRKLEHEAIISLPSTQVFQQSQQWFMVYRLFFSLLALILAFLLKRYLNRLVMLFKNRLPLIFRYNLFDT